MKKYKWGLAVVVGLLLCGSAQAEPPFGGTIFLDADIITENDRSAFESISSSGRGDRWMYDRRVNGWVCLNAHLFNALYQDGFQIEVQVNPEFDQASAQGEAENHALVIGRLPTCLRADVQTVWIHQGNQPFGGGNDNLLIHTGKTPEYVAAGILEETLVHEASHTSLDASHANTAGWVAAQVADGEFISTYARDFPRQEDVAESFLPYLALRYRSARISEALAATIEQTMPNRIAYFDAQRLDLTPIADSAPLRITRFVCDPGLEVVRMEFNSRTNGLYALEASFNLSDWDVILGHIASQGISTHLSHPIPSRAIRAFFRVREVPR